LYEVKYRPMSMVPGTYLKMQWTIFKCIIVRACMNWEKKFTLYEISLCVSVRYCKSPTSLKKEYGSSSKVSFAKVLVLALNGVLMGLLSTI
jgi:hypothetical protein